MRFFEDHGGIQKTTKTFTDSEKKAIASSAQRIATLINNSLKIARRSSNSKIKLSAVEKALQNIQEIKQMKRDYPFLTLVDLEQIEDELDLIRVTCDAPFGQSVRIQDGAVHITFDKSHGEVEGKYYAEHVESYKDLKRAGRLEEACILLKKCVKAAERETAKFRSKEGWENYTLAPAYYWELAIIYRKMKLYALECDILERYINNPAAVKERLGGFAERLEKAQNLKSKGQ